jgi:hypothetical protein
MTKNQYHWLLSILLLLIGYLQPSVALLNTLFGLGFFVLDYANFWQPGTIWLENNRLIALFCFLVPPIISVIGLSRAMTFLAFKISATTDNRWKPVSLIAIFTLLVFILRADPSRLPISFHSYLGANY